MFKTYAFYDRRETRYSVFEMLCIDGMSHPFAAPVFLLVV